MYYLQIHGEAKGLWCHRLYMEDYERQALESAAHPLHLLKWYVGDTHIQVFTDHLNGINDNIKWKTEGEVTIHKELELKEHWPELKEHWPL